MQFIAFDLESTDGCFSSGNICEFGYCVANEKFEIEKQDNILIRPIGKMNFAYYRVKLAYPLKVYYRSPSFAENYAKIGAILQKPDCVVLGHAIHNDIVGINSACNVNTLKPYNFVFVDTQILFSIYKGASGVISLDKIAEEIGEQFNHHRADEDARLSLLTLKYICEKEKMTFEQLMAYYEATIGVNDDGVITNFVSKKCAGQAPSITSKNSKRRILAMFEPVPVDIEYIDKNNPLYKKKIFFNLDTMIEDIDLTRAVWTKLEALGAKVVHFINKCDFYIGNLEDSENFSCKVLSMQELLEMVGEINIVSYNDKAILERYMELKEEQRKTEKLKKVNDKNKQSLKK